MPAVAQRPAAVVRPLTEPLFLKMTPAPRKLMPLTTWAAIRAGSDSRTPAKKPPGNAEMSAKAYLDTIIISAAAQQTMMWVRRPAPLNRRVRS